MWERGRSLTRAFLRLRHHRHGHSGGFYRHEHCFAGGLEAPLGLRLPLEGSSALAGGLRGPIFPLGCRFLSSHGRDATARKHSDEDGPPAPSGGGRASESGKEERVSSYWGVMRPTVTKEDGTAWPWNCFMVI